MTSQKDDNSSSKIPPATTTEDAIGSSPPRAQRAADQQGEEKQQENDNNHDSSSSLENDDGFVNQGLRRWEEARASWLGSDDSHSTPRAAVPMDVDEVIDLIFSQRWRTQQDSFRQPVPLPQMVDILVDLWEAEGLDV